MKATLLATALLCGCGPHAPPSYPGPPEVTLGTGATDFVPVNDGDAVPIIHGVQGGYHIWGSVRARYVDPQQVHLHFTVTLVGGAAREALRDDNVDLDGTSDGLTVGQHLGSAVIFVNGDSVRGKPCRWHFDLTDMEGRAVTIEKTITPM